ncbi:polyprenyl synthetase family protein [Blastopirellula marina]|uniref:Geranylgeranyl pyrophosphate synthetase (Precursor) n=1 Tax=Blastopirellula marina DSM 3645 TaxID=314230 RepID=A3ZQ14_9BACT|nr:farnesyl diphosphate synthase [Blastopirellula marina]EAQ81287.1 geranylgeranyl pyrophosphate synthetase (precursor) [Blastopirellula marina DSM 3645]
MTSASLATLHEYSDTLRDEVDQALNVYSSFGEGCPDRLQEAIRYSLLAPGKRLRPLLTLMAAETCGSDRTQAMPSACAVEMIHAYSLIHDDLPAMDDDDLRRGRPTCHKAFDEATAILAGDALLARALEIVADGYQDPLVAARSCRELAKAAGATALVGGQADDLNEQFGSGDVEMLKAIHRRKTGAMICVSLRLGAIAAGADDQQVAQLNLYGEQIGLAFQIVDDLLDYAGDEAALGKRVGKDAERGKLTYPGLIGVAESRRQAESLIAGAKQSLADFGERANHLEALAQYILERNH